ncbi:zinc finger protein [Plasmodium gonderi]|uniref:Zinc finger protein n=1 Tax=Plasmodium gonderi TaxID=77519 RepID=A0A1Y1JDJ0_PLAGO|nr:zinc finger protein [Plasmodium gonderi]GAW79277.1 zinc finger protein [Plasmodium gonderi]
MDDEDAIIVDIEEKQIGEKSMDIKSVYNIRKEDLIFQEYVNKNNNSAINMFNNDQVNVYIENRDLNKKTYNCYTCNIQIYNYSFFRYHFKSEWHKYNLKRKLLNLNAVNEITFNEKVQILAKGDEKNNSTHKNDQISNEKSDSNRAQKKQSNSNKKKKEKKNNVDFYNNKKMNSNSNINNNSVAQKIQYATKEDILLTKNVKYDNPMVCFFDNRIFNSVEENIKHMNDNYTFYIPDLKYVTNLKKVILTIGKKIYEENICIYCFRYSKCVKSLQSHMICKSHTKLHADFFIFIQKYYDFSKSYVDLLNRYITNKEDKELLLCMLHKKIKKQIGSKCHISAKYYDDEPTSSYKYNTQKRDTGDGVICDRIEHENHVNNFAASDNSPNSIRDKNLSLHFSDTEEQKVDLNVKDKSENDNSDDYKVKEEDLSKNITYDTIYEALQQFGYMKPELNEYNNLVLPDGSEAINRKIAYIFKQKLPLQNRTMSKCDKIDVLKKKESNQDYRSYSYYLDVMKKYNLDLNVKTNNLNKFYKSDSIFFL